MICQGSPGTLYVNCICIARRRICSVIRGSWCAGTASGDAILAARAGGGERHPGFGEQVQAGGEYG